MRVKNCVDICFFKVKFVSSQREIKNIYDSYPQLHIVVTGSSMRETYFASQLAVGHQLSMPNQGNLVVDGRWLFEVGGKNKGFKQIKGIEDSFVVSDGIDIGYGKKIPLWLFGLLY